MKELFTSECVGKGHPDKVCDIISDSILDAYLTVDGDSKVACETMVCPGKVILAGEIYSKGEVDVEAVVRKAIAEIGYTHDKEFSAATVDIENYLHAQSPDIRQGVDRAEESEQGAGDQGLMFGYACIETGGYVPFSHALSAMFLRELDEIREAGEVMTYMRPDTKSQVTVEYDGKEFLQVDTVVLAISHTEKDSLGVEITSERVKEDVMKYVVPSIQAKLGDDEKLNLSRARFLVNTTGKFVVHGPIGDSGLTGRKLIVDTYGGHAPFGGGALSGKDSSKVDRTGQYGARHLAKNLVHVNVCDKCTVQVAYAIGVADPVSVDINTHGTCHLNITDARLGEIMMAHYSLKPFDLVKRFALRTPIFTPTASYGHFGRTPGVVEVNGEEFYTFGWERLDLVTDIPDWLKAEGVDCSGLQVVKD